jgi:hypothetical protein
MKIKLGILGWLLLCGGFVQAQNKFSISGTVRDSITGETLIGVNIVVQELPSTGVSTNEYGFYSLTLPQGNYTLMYSYIGYDLQTRNVVLHGNLQQDVALSGNQNLEEVVISAEKENAHITRPVSVISISKEEMDLIPTIGGVKDPMKVLSYMPGIKSVGEGNSGLNVRGGNADQNLILLDEAPVYNASHLLGFFSTFNADAVKNLTLYKEGMPAQYGGRLSSVIDVQMNEGNNQKFHVGGGIGLIDSRLFVEAPLVKDKSSFLITGRRTYADLFLKLSNDPALKNNTLYFYDVNAKLNYKISSKDQLFLSGYFGRDNFAMDELFGVDWGNATGTLRWNHLFSPKLFANTSLIYSQYNYKVSIENGSNEFALTSKIRDINLKHDYDFFLNPQHTLKFGFNVIHHTLMPRTTESSSENSSVNSNTPPNKYSLESSVFISDNWSPNPRWNIEYGLRFTSFAILGGGDEYELDKNKNIIDTLSYASGEIVQHYLNLEPRLALAYIINPSLSLKASYTRNVQNLHLISNSTAATPTDRWVQSSQYIKPEISDQISLGWFKNFAQNQYELSIETYYKTLQNQIDYKDGADLRLQDPIETQLLFGEGRAYGLEFLIRKKTGRLTGWVAYTLSRSEKKIEGINQNDWYFARQDRTHDVSVVGMYKLSKKWTISGVWVYNTGNAVSFPTGKYRIDNTVIFNYSERNGYRMPAYHRLDLSAVWQLKKNEKTEQDLSFSIYNAYSRGNAYTITFEEDPDNPSQTRAVKTVLFKMMPSITYNFKF